MIPQLLISEVEILPVKPRNGLVAFGSCVVNHALYLGCIAIHTRPDGSGYRLVYPDRILPNGKQVQVFHPINREAGDVLERALAEKIRSLTRMF